MTEEPVGVFASGYQIFRACKFNKEVEDAPRYDYRLIGPNKQEFYLMRVPTQLHIMVAMDLENRQIALPFRGTYFSDQNNELVIAKQVEQPEHRNQEQGKESYE